MKKPQFTLKTLKKKSMTSSQKNKLKINGRRDDGLRLARGVWKKSTATTPPTGLTWCWKMWTPIPNTTCQNPWRKTKTHSAVISDNVNDRYYHRVLDFLQQTWRVLLASEPVWRSGARPWIVLTCNSPAACVSERTRWPLTRSGSERNLHTDGAKINFTSLHSCYILRSTQVSVHVYNMRMIWLLIE